MSSNIATGYKLGMILQEDTWSMSRRKQDNPQHLYSNENMSIDGTESGKDTVDSRAASPSLPSVSTSTQGKDWQHHGMCKVT